VIYLNMSLDLARALVRAQLEDRGIRPEDVLPEARPDLIATTVRSATRGAPSSREELAYFGRKKLRVETTEQFATWFS
jgi:hypothetical protein